MNTHKFFMVALLLSFIINNSSLFAQTENIDSAFHPRKYRYYSIPIWTGIDLSLNKKDNGILQVNFPYTIKSSNGINSSYLFTATHTSVNNIAKLSYLFYGFEIGTSNHFFDACVSGFMNGTSLRGGYGLIWNGKYKMDDGTKDIMNKPFMIKTSINLINDYTNFNTKRRRLGSIDNENNYIDALGYEARPTYSITTSTRSGSVTNTYGAKNLDIAYSQSQLSLLPEITISSNPFRNGRPVTDKKGRPIAFKRYPNARRRSVFSWQVSIGYKIALYDKGGIAMFQDNGKRHSKQVGSDVSLDYPGLSVQYNRKTITSAPYRFSGLCITLILASGRSKIK